MTELKNFPLRFIDRPWGKLAYRESGGGHPVIFLHGEGRDHSDWSKIIPYISSNRLIVPDLQGHGESTVPHEAPALNHMVDDIVALSNDLWLGKADIIGHSLGGIIAQQMLRRFPEKIGRLILIEGWVNLKYSHVLNDNLTAGLTIQLAAEISKEVHDTFVRWMPAFRDEFWATVERCDTEVMLQETSHEVLHIYGDRDIAQFDPAKIGLHPKANVTLELFKGAGHFLHLSHADKIGKMIQHKLCPQTEEPKQIIPANLMGLYNYRSGQR